MPVTTYCEKYFKSQLWKYLTDIIKIFPFIYIRLFYYWDLKLKINKYWSWTHWLALMILSSKVDLCLAIKIVYISLLRSHIFILSLNLAPHSSPFILGTPTRRKDNLKWRFTSLTNICNSSLQLQQQAVDPWPKHLNRDKFWVENIFCRFQYPSNEQKMQIKSQEPHFLSFSPFFLSSCSITWSWDSFLMSLMSR